MIYAVEPWAAVKDAAQPLLQRHWEEVALDRDKIPLALDLALYDALADAGVLWVVTARDAGVLVGYYTVLVQKHLHFSTTLTAFTDLIFLEKTHRKGRAGQRLIEAAEAMLSGLGVKQILTGTKQKPDLGPLLRRMGYGLHEVSYSKLIG